jgi:hypothetical protein
VEKVFRNGEVGELDFCCTGGGDTADAKGLLKNVDFIGDIGEIIETVLGVGEFDRSGSMLTRCGTISFVFKTVEGVGEFARSVVVDGPLPLCGPISFALGNADEFDNGRCLAPTTLGFLTRFAVKKKFSPGSSFPAVRSFA